MSLDQYNQSIVESYQTFIAKLCCYSLNNLGLHLGDASLKSPKDEQLILTQA